MASLNAASTLASVALVCIQPLFVAAFSGVLLHEPMSRAARPGALTALLGAALIGLNSLAGQSGDWEGDLLALAGACASPSRLALPCGPGAGKHPPGSYPLYRRPGRCARTGGLLRSAGGAGGGHALGDALFQKVSYAPGGSGGGGVVLLGLCLSLRAGIKPAGKS